MIVYSGRGEVLVITSSYEHLFIKEYFDEGGRDKDDYDREEAHNVVEIGLNAKVSVD